MDTFFVNCGTKIALLEIKRYLCPSIFDGLA